MVGFSGCSQWPIAQMVEQLTVNQPVPGSSPGGPAIAPVAQLVEQLICNEHVACSSHVGGL